MQRVGGRDREIDAKQMLDLMEHKEFVVQTVAASGSQQQIFFFFFFSVFCVVLFQKHSNFLFAAFVKFMFSVSSVFCFVLFCLTAKVWTLFMGQENAGFDTSTCTHRHHRSPPSMLVRSLSGDELSPMNK